MKMYNFQNRRIKNKAWNGMVDKSEKQEENVSNMSPGRFVTKVNVNRAPKNEDV